jgi:hypothetical protein
MAFVFRAERKIDLATEETSKNPNLAPGAYLGLESTKTKQTK